LACTLASPFLGRKPKARVATCNEMGLLELVLSVVGVRWNVVSGIGPSNGMGWLGWDLLKLAKCIIIENNLKTSKK